MTASPPVPVHDPFSGGGAPTPIADAPTGVPPTPPAPAAPPAPLSNGRRWLGLGALLVLTAVLYLWDLAASGWANQFYAAAAQAGSQNWEAWFFGSLDAGNSITVDKPPASLWIMGLSMRLFGVNSWALLVPEALMGVLTAWCAYATVRRVLNHGVVGGRTGSELAAHRAGLAAWVITALTPVAVLMFRFDNPDALLVLLITASIYATVRASEKGSRGWLVWAGVAVGFAFLTKTLQAFLVLPALIAAYLIASPTKWGRKFVDLLCAFAAVIVSAGWYVAIFELMPTSARPYMGGSQTNSFLELMISYNGLGRITGHETGSVGGGAQRGPNAGTGGLTRLFTGVSGGMVSWLLPAALILTVFALIVLFKRRPDAPTSGRNPRLVTGSLVAIAGTLLVTGLVFSFMEGIYHDYYTVALAPTIGMTVALAGAVLWLHRDSTVGGVGLATASIVTGIWSFMLARQAGGVYQVIGIAALVLGIVAGIALLFSDRLPQRLAGLALAAALVAGVAGPAAYSINTAATPHTGSIVTAGPVSERGGRGGGMGGPGQNGQTGRQRGTGTTGQSGTTGRGQWGQNGQTGTNGQSGTNGQNGAGQGLQPGGMPPNGMGQPPAGFPGAGMGPNGTGAGTGNGTTQGGFQRGGFGEDGGMGGASGMGGLLNGATVSSQMKTLLETDASKYTWVAATVGSQNSASYQLATGDPVMAIGGFNGSDPSPTLDQFKALVAQGKIHYFIGGGSFGGQNGGSDVGTEIQTWVKATYNTVTVDGTTVYDLTSPK